MADINPEDLDAEMIQFAIRESIQDSSKLPWSIKTDRMETHSSNYLNIVAAIEQGDVSTLQGLSGCLSAFRERDRGDRLPLHRAAAQTNPEILELLLQVCTASDVSLEVQTGAEQTPLSLQTDAGQTPLSLEEQTGAGQTPLSLQTDAGQTPLSLEEQTGAGQTPLSLEEQTGAGQTPLSLEEQTGAGQTPLSLEEQTGAGQTPLSLEEQTGAGQTPLSLEEQTGAGQTPLILAVEEGLLENVRVLLRHGASPHNTDSMNQSPLLLAVRQSCYEMVLSLIMGGAFVEQVCLTKWTVLHEAAKVGCPAILMLLLRHGGMVTARDAQGVTPLGIAAEYGNTEALEKLIQHGGDVNAQAYNGDTVLYDAAGSGNLDSIQLLLQHGANPNMASYACQLPVHRAAYEGHYLALQALVPVTTKRAIRLSGQNPVHSAADGGHAVCLQLLLEKGFDVNALLGTHISENYADLRKSPLFFAVSNGDVTCTEILLAAGASADLDTLHCLLVAIRAERYELVRLLLSYGADVNCYFTVINDTVFPTALQYSLRDPVMLRLLLNNGYHTHKCFQCCHGDSEEMDSSWVDLHNQVYQSYSQSDTITFCEFVSVSSLSHLVGGVLRTLLDYVSHVSLCPNLQRILERKAEWPEICDILGQPRSLQHLCRLVIRGRMSPRTLNNPEAMAAVPFPPRLKHYLTYAEYDLYSRPSST